MKNTIFTALDAKSMKPKLSYFLIFSLLLVAQTTLARERICKYVSQNMFHSKFPGYEYSPDGYYPHSISSLDYYFGRLTVTEPWESFFVQKADGTETKGLVFLNLQSEDQIFVEPKSLKINISTSSFPENDMTNELHLRPLSTKESIFHLHKRVKINDKDYAYEHELLRLDPESKMISSIFYTKIVQPASSVDEIRLMVLGKYVLLSPWKEHEITETSYGTHKLLVYDLKTSKKLSELEFRTWFAAHTSDSAYGVLSYRNGLGTLSEQTVSGAQESDIEAAILNPQTFQLRDLKPWEKVWWSTTRQNGNGENYSLTSIDKADSDTIILRKLNTSYGREPVPVGAHVRRISSLNWFSIIHKLPDGISARNCALDE